VAAPWNEKDAIREWQVWAREVAPQANVRMKEIAETLKADPHAPERRQFKLLADLDRKLCSLRSCLGSWIVDQTLPHNEVKFSPVWPAHYAERLFVGIPTVLMLSATVRPKTAHLLGVSDADMDFHEYDSSFPLSLRPVYHVPTVRMNHRTDDYGLRLWLSRIDQIIGARLDRKGIIHTVSYDRRSFVMTHSEHIDVMMSHSSENTTYTIEQFKRAQAPKVLVSPSVSTGFDFPEDFCRYQIIGKLGFIDTRNKLSAARCESDPDYSPYIAMQQLIQACGRGVRSVTDWCESIIIDDNIGWFLKKYKRFAPRWFLQAYKALPTLPDPPDLSSMQKSA
jgi:Rad3-related DNA helicase